MSYTKRDSKDPMPNASNSQRAGKDGGGNTPVTGESHDQSKGSKVSASANRSTGPTASAVDQPTRQDGGNTTVTGELHGQKKASKVPESARW